MAGVIGMISNLSPQLKAIIAVLVILGIVALAVGDKQPISPNQAALSFSEFDQVISSPIEVISPVELADYLMKQEHHYNLLDLREQGAGYQIPTSESHSLKSFLDLKIPVNETIFIYSANETSAIQLYYLLVIRGYFKVKVLAGGMSAWTSQILQPLKADIPAEALEHRTQLTYFFGGTIRDGNAASNLISLKPIVLEKKKKKHKGC